MELIRETKRRARRWILPVLGLVVVLAGFLGWRQFGPSGGAGREAAAARPPAAAVPVTMAPVETAPFPVILTGLGTVQPYNTVVVRTRVDGQINAVEYQEGQAVKAGDVLVRIDPRPYQAALDQARAKKAQDEANLANARVDLQRYTKLGEFSARQQTDTQAATVAQLTAQVAADQALLDNAETQLSYATVQAPISGLTGFRQVDVGNIVTAAGQTGLVTINQIEPMSVVFTAPEEKVGDIRQALAAGRVPVAAYATDGRRKISEGFLELINNQVDAASGTIRLKATFDNKDHALWPGLSVSTRMRVSTIADALTVPDDAVQHGPNGLFAYVVDEGGKAQMQAVTVVGSAEGRSAIEGLKPGQKVITAGQYRVQPGGAVAEAPPPVRQASGEAR